MSQVGCITEQAGKEQQMKDKEVRAGEQAGDACQG